MEGAACHSPRAAAPGECKKWGSLLHLPAACLTLPRGPLSHLEKTLHLTLSFLLPLPSSLMPCHLVISVCNPWRWAQAGIPVPISQMENQSPSQARLGPGNPTSCRQSGSSWKPCFMRKPSDPCREGSVKAGGQGGARAGQECPSPRTSIFYRGCWRGEREHRLHTGHGAWRSAWSFLLGSIGPARLRPAAERGGRTCWRRWWGRGG